jgi:L-arabinose isomerase
VLSSALGIEALEDLAEIAGLELIVIDEETRVRDLADRLRWNEAYYGPGRSR